jgi:hypothetical protein
MGSISAKALHCWRDTMRFHAAIAQPCTENAMFTACGLHLWHNARRYDCNST